MNRLTQGLMCVGLLLTVAVPAMADHRDRDSSSLSVVFHSPYTDIHYRDVSPSRSGYGNHYSHRHGHNCGHHWNGRYWGKPVPYYYGYRYGEKRHHKNHHNRYDDGHRKGKHHRDDRSRDGHGYGWRDKKHQGRDKGDKHHGRDKGDKHHGDKGRRHGD